MSSPQLQQPLSDGEEDTFININTNESTEQTNIEAIDTEKKRIDSKALNGLRGVAAFHIMVFHSFYYSKLKIDLLGSVQMPLFFLISGFIFALNDGKQKYFATKCCTELCTYPQEANINENENGLKHFHGKNYYQRRIARTIPLFYLTNLMCIPLVFAGHAWLEFDVTFFIALIFTIFVVNTWFGVPIVLNGPSWFVSTIWFFYWCFPSLIPKLQTMDNEKKQKWINYHYGIQFIVGFVLFAGFMLIAPQWAFNIATFWPISRLPVFIIGVLAGLLRNDGLTFRGKKEYSIKKWKKVTDINALIMVIVFIVLSVLGIILQFLFGIPLFPGLWFQLGIPLWQLLLITALTFGEGTSITYKILTSKLILFIGKISYALYLVHEPFIQYICWIYYGPISRPQCDVEEGDDDNYCQTEWEDYNDKRLMPIWCIPILWIVSILVAVLLNRLIEEPMRKCLRPKKR